MLHGTCAEDAAPLLLAARDAYLRKTPRADAVADLLLCPVEGCSYSCGCDIGPNKTFINPTLRLQAIASNCNSSVAIVMSD